MGQTTAGKERRERNRKDNVSAVTSAGNQAMEKEIAAGNNMYGSAVNTAINEELVDLDLAKRGSYFIQDGGDFIRTDAAGYNAARKAGKKVHRSYQMQSKGANIKYGSGGTSTAMGTGDPTGAITSVPISQQMLKQQNMVKGVAVAAASLAMPGAGASLMRLDAGKAFKDAARPETAYKEYKARFDAKQAGKKPPPRSNILTDAFGAVKASLGGGNKKSQLGQ